MSAEATRAVTTNDALTEDQERAETLALFGLPADATREQILAMDAKIKAWAAADDNIVVLEHPAEDRNNGNSVGQSHAEPESADQAKSWEENATDAATWWRSYEHSAPKLSLLGDNLLLERKFGLLVGAAGSGKTHTMAHLFLCFALGKPWFGFPVKQSKTSWLDLEMDGDELREMIQRVADEPSLWGGNRLDDKQLQSALRRFGSIVAADNAMCSRMKLSDETNRKNVVTWLARHGTEVWLLDSLQRGHGGNEFEEITQEVTAIEQIMREAEIACLAIHHEGQEANHTKHSRDRAQQMYASRGRTELTDAVRLMFRLVEEGPLDEEGRERLKLVTAKATYAKRPDIVHLVRSESGVIIPAATPPKPPPTKDELIWDAVQVLLGKKVPVTIKTVMTESGVGRSSVQRHLEYLQMTRKLELITTGKAYEWVMPQPEFASD